MVYLVSEIVYLVFVMVYFIWTCDGVFAFFILVVNEYETQQEKQRGVFFIESLFEVFDDCCVYKDTTQLLIANNNNNNMVIQTQTWKTNDDTFDLGGGRQCCSLYEPSSSPRPPAITIVINPGGER